MEHLLCETRATAGEVGYGLISDTLFLYDGWNMIQVMDGAETVEKTYVYGLDLSQSNQGAGHKAHQDSHHGLHKLGKRCHNSSSSWHQCPGASVSLLHHQA